MELTKLGYGPHFADQMAGHDNTRIPARVVRMDGIRAHVWTEHGQQVVDVPGKIRAAREHGAVVGDWVVVLTGTSPVIERVLDRRTRIVRAAAGLRTRVQVIAANVDVVFVVMGLDGDFSPARVERYLATIADANAQPVVLLTKTGACRDVEEKQRELAPVLGNVPCHAIDVVDGIDADVPHRYARAGVTVAVLGSSGAGKSTLVNHLLGREHMATASVREHDSRGRHTTTQRELVVTPSGAILIDNPGMRELSLWLEGEGLDQAFDDVSSLAGDCRFGNCTHQGEPHCAVRAAVDEGTLDAHRLERYTSLQEEVAATNLRREEHQRRHGERAQGRLYKSIQAERRRRKGGR